MYLFFKNVDVYFASHRLVFLQKKREEAPSVAENNPKASDQARKLTADALYVSSTRVSDRTKPPVSDVFYESKKMDAAFINQLRGEIGYYLVQELSPFISDESRKGLEEVTKGQGMQITIELLQNHPELFKSQTNERAEALKIYARIQKDLKNKKITPLEAHTLVEECVINPMTAEFLKSSLEFSKTYAQMVKQLEDIIKDLPERDRKYLTKKYIVDKEKTLQEEFDQLHKKLEEKKRNRDAERGFYLDLMERKAVKNGSLKLKGGLNALFSKDAFFKAPVKDDEDPSKVTRRAFLIELKQALDTWDEQQEVYHSKLQRLKDKGWMNETSYKLFRVEFDHSKLEKRQKWIDDPSELNKREELGKDIDQMKESPRKAFLKKKSQEVGYKKLSALFKEDEKVHKNYMAKLETYKKDPNYNLPERTFKQYVDWAESESLPRLKVAIDLLSTFAQMGRFGVIERSLGNMTHEQCGEYNEHREQWTFEQKMAFIKSCKEQNKADLVEIDDLLDAENSKNLSQINDKGLRNSLLTGLSTLLGMGKDKFKQFARMIKRVFGGSSVNAMKEFSQGTAEVRAKTIEEDMQGESLNLPTEKSSHIKVSQLELALKRKRGNRPPNNQERNRKQEPLVMGDIDEDLTQWTQAERVEDNLDVLEAENGLEVSTTSGFVHVGSNDGETDNAAYINLNNTEAGLNVALRKVDQIDENTAFTLAASNSGNQVELEKVSERRDFAQLVEEMAKKL